jgi:hypothetical protein
VTNSEDVQSLDPSAADLRIGEPERAAARAALEEHVDAERLDEAEFHQRSAACDTARTRSELRQLFADLPAPHPDLSGGPAPSTAADEDVSLLGWTVGLALLLGLPVAVVLGVVYGAWWSLAVPVGLSVVMLYAEHLLTTRR